MWVGLAWSCMGGQAATRDWGVERLGPGNLVVAVAGVLLATFGSWHVLEHGVGSGIIEATWTVFITVMLPLLSAGSVLVFYRWTETRDYVVARWVLGCIAALTLLAVWASFDSLVAGDYALASPTLILGANLGILFGAVAGINRARARRNAELVRRERAQREGLVTLNHLLRHHVLNGMTIIDGYADELRHEGASEEYVGVIEHQSERVVTLVENVQTLVDSVSGTTDTTAVDLTATVEHAVADIRETYPGATVDVDLEPAAVRANQYVRSVVDNLLANAVEHHDGDPRVEVTLQAGDPVVLRVADDGPGVPDPIRDSFERADGVATGLSGDGMGLYLVDTLVSSYGGTASIDPRDPRGTVVTVELPRA